MQHARMSRPSAAWSPAQTIARTPFGFGAPIRRGLPHKLRLDRAAQRAVRRRQLGLDEDAVDERMSAQSKAVNCEPEGMRPGDIVG
jgi:hypothetical protein